MKKTMAILMAIIIMLSITASALPLLVGASDSQNPYLERTFIDEEGREIDVIAVPGRPPEIKAPVVAVPEPDIAKGINVLPNVPAFDWSYGCSATAAAMMFGHYDNAGYTNMYTGPTNGGVCPMTNSPWGLGECPLSATHQGYDGLATKGHVDDYWYTYGSTVDPYFGNWAEHGYADCTADYMGTNQYQNWQNTDGSTWFIFYTDGSPTYDYTLCEGWTPPIRDGCHGTRLFVESRGYNVLQNYNQYIYGYDGNTIGFTFAQFQAEIDAGRPVLIQVEWHTMLGYGYNTAGNIVYIHDTWDHNDHQMAWGGKYFGHQHYAVTVIDLTGGVPPSKPDLVIEKSVTIEDCNFIVNYTVTNIGDGAAGASITCKLVDGTIEESQPCLALGAGASYSSTFDPEPCSCGETLNVTVCADNNDDVTESDETNNCEVNFVECPPCLPDLVISNIWTVGNKIHYTIKNKGCIPAPTSYTGLYIDGIYRARDSVDGLAPGESSNEEFARYNYKGGEIKVCADYQDRIEEIDETNNCRGDTAEKPDLEIVEKWEEWESATHYIVTYTIHNKGTAVAPACHNTTLYVDGVAIEHKHVPVDLAYCETYTDTFDTVIECTPPFDIIRVCADNYNVIDELDETNNCLENEWRCEEEEEKPDLVIEDKWEDWESANHYIVSYTIHNKGTAVAPACHNTTLYVDGVAIEHKHVPVDLAYCETYTDTFDTVIECTPPFDIIRVCADNYNVIDELDETNNCLENEWRCEEEEEKPDLVITDIWVVDNRIHYTIENIGGEPAPTSYTGLYIDGRYSARDRVDPLAPDGDSDEVFAGYNYRGGEIRVCADYQDRIEEIDEDNNCLEEGNNG